MRLTLAFLRCVALRAVLTGPFILTGCDAASSDGNVSGQMFVATGGGQSVKLGDVEVALYEREPIAEYLKQVAEQTKESRGIVSKELDFAKEANEQALSADEQAHDAYIKSDFGSEVAIAYDKEKEASAKIKGYYGIVLDAALYLDSGGFYFQQLPRAAATTRTDADGRYSLPVSKSGNYVLVAVAKRLVLEDAEIYYWMVGFTFNSESSLSLNLANENMTSGTSKASLIHTINASNEARLHDGNAALSKVIITVEHRTEKERAEQKEAEVAKVIAARAEARAEEEHRKAYEKAHFPQLVRESQARALKKHPDLGIAGSPLNKQFVQMYQTLQAVKSDRLQQPDWPEKLADEIAASR